MKPKKFAVLAILLAASAQIPFPEGLAAQESKTLSVTPCIHLEHEAKKYSLAYYGYNCSHEGYTAIPESLYDSLHSWAYNATHARILSKIDGYKITARLATVDTRCERGFYLGPCNYGPWVHYKWTHHAGSAYYGVSDSLGSTPVVVNSLINPLLTLKLADKDPHLSLVFKESNKLSRAKRTQLVQLLANAEKILSKEEGLMAAPLSIDDAAKKVPSHEEARRKNYQKFRLIYD